jgi:hypothetical protein
VLVCRRLDQKSRALSVGFFVDSGSALQPRFLAEVFAGSFLTEIGILRLSRRLGFRAHSGESLS